MRWKERKQFVFLVVPFNAFSLRLLRSQLPPRGRLFGGEGLRANELNYNHNYARRAIHAVTANHESATFNSRKLKGCNSFACFHYQKTRVNGAIARFLF